MLVKDRMSTHPLTISTNESISSTHHYMQEQKVRHLPVLDKSGKMVGLVTDEDLLKAEPSAATSLSMWEIHSLLDKLRVKDVMVRNVVTTAESTPIEEAAHLMRDHKIGCLPVLREGKLVGIITETDILTAFMEFFSARQKGLRITLSVPDREGELAKVAQAIADQGGYIAACGTFMVDEPDMWGMVLKVRNVDREVLTDTLSKIAEAEVTDVREV
jgi:acetoin utilization protein AcuB